MKTKFLLTLCIAVFTANNVFSAESKTISGVPYEEISISGGDTTLSEKILKELKVIRYHAEKTDQLREEAKKRHEQRSSHQPDQSKEGDTSIVSAEYEVLSEIEYHTKGDNIKDGWNLYGWVAFGIALVSLVFSIITYRAQKKVEEQTKNASLEVQCGVLDDLYRHLYRNLICTCAIIYKFRGINGVKSTEEYPSEVNLQKLTTLPEDVILPIDIKDDDIYSHMHEMKKLLKNYNMEIDIASKHFACKEIKDKHLKNDYDNLLFKPLFLIENTFRLWDKFKKHNKALKPHKHEYALYKFVLEHFSKLDFAKINNSATQEYLKKTDDRFNERNSFNSLFDCLVSIEDIEENSIQRSLDKFCKSLSDQSPYIGKDMQISKEKFNDYLNSLNCENVKDLIKKKREGCNEKLEELKPLFEQYFELFNKDEWMLDELLFHILRIDIALEIPKIGMINYH